MSLIEDILPAGMCIEQMPARLVMTPRVRFLLRNHEGDQFDGLLISSTT